MLIEIKNSENVKSMTFTVEFKDDIKETVTINNSEQPIVLSERNSHKIPPEMLDQEF